MEYILNIWNQTFKCSFTVIQLYSIRALGENNISKFIDIKALKIQTTSISQFKNNSDFNLCYIKKMFLKCYAKKNRN